MSYQFRPASRSEAKPLIGLYAESGCGKTYGALQLARGFVGPSGKIGMIETESGRGEAYADLLPGGYDVLPLRNDFSPKCYGEAISAAEAAKLDALIIDSASHEWEGVGGVLDMAAKNQAAAKKGPLVWQQPKMDHQRFFMLRLMQTPIPLVIVCMRAKYPMQERKDRNGNKEWVRSEVLEPKQADDILSEMFIHAWIDKEHRLHVTKWTRPDLKTVIHDGEPIGIETGRALAEWARGSTAPAPPPQTVAQPAASSADPPLIAEGAMAAERGVETLRAFWQRLTPGQKRSVGGEAQLDRWKATAQEADKLAGVTESLPREARNAYAAEREEAHEQLDRDMGWGF